MLLVQWRLRVPSKSGDADQTKLEKLRRVDFVGAFCLCLAVFSICFVLEVGGQKVPWNSSTVYTFTGVGLLASIAFVISATQVQEPVFPLRLITHYDVVTNYLILILQIIVQISLMMAVPLYFQATKRASISETGLYLLPAFAGNTLGGLLSGYWIKGTGDFKLPTVLSPILALCCMTLCFLRWNGNTEAWESLYIFPGGLATGIITSSAFVGVAARVPKQDLAVAGGGMYLCVNIGGVAGASIGSAVHETALRMSLNEALRDVENGSEVGQDGSIVSGAQKYAC